jgi:hypothetical protein
MDVTLFYIRRGTAVPPPSPGKGTGSMLVSSPHHQEATPTLVCDSEPKVYVLEAGATLEEAPPIEARSNATVVS